MLNSYNIKRVEPSTEVFNKLEDGCKIIYKTLEPSKQRILEELDGKYEAELYIKILLFKTNLVRNNQNLPLTQEQQKLLNSTYTDVSNTENLRKFLGEDYPYNMVAKIAPTRPSAPRLGNGEIPNCAKRLSFT